MSPLDLIFFALIVGAAFTGYRYGFLARVASWAGLAIGLYLSLRLLPTVLSAFDLPSSSSRLLVAAVVLVVGTFIGNAIGLVVGHRVRGVLPVGGARTADRVVGAGAGALSVLVGLWLLLPAIADVPGFLSRAARDSAIANLVDDVFPEPPDTTRAVRALVNQRAFPQVFDSLTPAPNAGAPPASSGLPAEVEARVIASSVKVLGEACGRIQEGSGFVVQDNVVVTNAHVVAGVERVEVSRPDGRRVRATVAVFDSRKDLAVLRTDRLALPALGRASGKVGLTGAVFGHPGGQEAVRPAPARISEETPAEGDDIYGNDGALRQIFILAASLQPGDSGGPMVDVEGRVVGVAFAIAPDRANTAYALTGSELDQAVAAYNQNAAAKADPGPCLAG